MVRMFKRRLRHKCLASVWFGLPSCHRPHNRRCCSARVRKKFTILRADPFLRPLLQRTKGVAQKQISAVLRGWRETVRKRREEVKAAIATGDPRFVFAVRQQLS